DKLFLVMGPWHHGQEIEDGSSLGALRFESNTSRTFQREVLLPFLDHYLKDNAPPLNVSPVTAFQTGTNVWQHFSQWPPKDSHPVKLYLQSDSKVSFSPPSSGTAFDEYVSDPAKPVPFRTRPAQPIGYDPPLTWVQWLVDDQRDVGSRPDVLSFESNVLTSPVTIAGAPVANIIASTTGTD